MARRALRGGRLVAAAEVGAGAEVLAIGAQDDRTAAVIVVERAERRRQTLDQVEIEEVVGRSLNLGRGHAIVADDDLEVAEPKGVASHRREA